MRLHPLVLVLLALSLACSGGDDAGPTTTNPPSVDEVLDQAAAAMAGVETAGFILERSGAPVYLDDGGRIAFESAEGSYAAPASSQALIEVTALGLRTRIGAVAIDGSTWITNPLTSRWEEAPADLTFDPAVLFDDERGWPTLLADGLAEAALIPGAAPGRQRVRGTVAAERVATLTGGLVAEPTEVELDVDTATGHVVEVHFEADGVDGSTAWRLALDDFDRPVTVERPELGSPAG